MLRRKSSVLFSRFSPAVRQSSTGSIFRDSVANKSGLSFALDGTMRSGAHDLRTFGAGTLRALCSQSALLRFLEGHRVFYSALENELDNAFGPTAAVWSRFAAELRRTPALQHDCEVLRGLVGAAELPPTPAAAAYAARLRVAGAEDSAGTPLLLGHAYTRYLADLFGGSMLGWPTKLALSLPHVPSFYLHPPSVVDGRRAFIERFYEALNDAGRTLSDAQMQRVVDEATLAFKLNAELYREGTGGAGLGMLVGAAAGGLRVLGGHAAARLRGGRRDVFGRAL
jgi:heme oxygenase